MLAGGTILIDNTLLKCQLQLDSEGIWKVIEFKELFQHFTESTLILIQEFESKPS